MSSTLRLTVAALIGTAVLPVKLSAAQVSASLVSSAAAIVLMGKVGAGLMVVLIFMATTSSTSADSIAAPSLITFNIYKAYINPQSEYTCTLPGFSIWIGDLWWIPERNILHLPFSGHLVELVNQDPGLFVRQRSDSYGLGDNVGEDIDICCHCVPDHWTYFGINSLDGFHADAIWCDQHHNDLKPLELID